MDLKIQNGGGMFGLNDNNQQPINNNPEPLDAPQAAPANPFGDNDNPVAPPSPELSQPVAPAAVPPLATITPPAEPASPSTQDDDLMGLKQQALQNLQPLVSHLDQSPEEKFKTTMMLIQATDNSALVKQAYEAANQITDEKARAQALLDVVNEINYFTHSNGDKANPKTN